MTEVAEFSSFLFCRGQKPSNHGHIISSQRCSTRPGALQSSCREGAKNTWTLILFDRDGGGAVRT